MRTSEITMIENSPALMLTQEMLDALGAHIGDEVEISVSEQKLIVRAVTEAERVATMEKIMDDLFAARRSAYERLAEGVK